MPIEVRPVILCGGSGTRLWPLSRSGFPKQFLCLSDKESLFQSAAKRLDGLNRAEINVALPYIICNEEHRFLAQEQLREIGLEAATYLLEPIGRNTAPALTLAALAAIEEGTDPVLIVTPADQVLADTAAYQSTITRAVAAASKGDTVILGVRPTRPHTGYGYIQTATQGEPQDAALPVRRFVEKPNAQDAQRYFDEGDYYWNAGIFVLKASVWLKMLGAFRSDILDATTEAWSGKFKDAAFIRPQADLFSRIPSESVDYAAMEKCPGSSFAISMVPLDAGWNDLGAWDAVWSVMHKDRDGNAHQGDVIATESCNNLVHATSRLVSLVGVSGLVVVEASDAVLVADKSRAQDVKHIVEMLNMRQRDEQVLHRKVHRPWGWYDTIDAGTCFKVKRIQVKPKASLSLQKHTHRAEHWIVVRGVAEVTKGESKFQLQENESTYIPKGEIHRLANPGEDPLELIEVQSGEYLGEDDILRIEDCYGRDA